MSDPMVTIPARVNKPIIFSGAMVRAILSGQKTQTRRVVNPKPSMSHLLAPRMHTLREGPMGVPRSCPYGKPGDRLWVREMFLIDNPEYVATYKSEPWRGTPNPSDAEVYYFASEKDPSIFPRWKPSIHMPRWASRITLEVTDVRVERLQDITEDDAKAEGCSLVIIDGFVECGTRKTTFRKLWDSINAKRGFGWDANPWVWCISFKIVDDAFAKSGGE